MPGGPLDLQGQYVSATFARLIQISGGYLYDGNGDRIPLRMRQDTSTQFTADNPVLESGEFAYETDTKYLKIGDGLTDYISLPYFSSGGGGTSGFSGFSGASTSGFSGISGYSGFSGVGISGFSGFSGVGISGFSGFSGVGISGFSGFSGASTSGFSGYSGISGYSGFSGVGTSGFSGYSGAGLSGFSGFSGNSTSGFSGFSGTSTSGYSGYSGISGYSGEVTDIEFIELDLKLSGSVLRYKEFTYTGDDLTKLEIYADSTKAVKIYTVDFAYLGADLSTVMVTRESDAYSYTKTFSYDGSGNLISIDIV